MVSSLASILAVGTALPEHISMQKDYAEALFQGVESNSSHKEKIQRICKLCIESTSHVLVHTGERSEIRKRHFHYQPRFDPSKPTSVSSKFAIATVEVPKLMAEAAFRALEEWGQPASAITHLVTVTITGMKAPGADYELVKLLGLRRDVKRVMVYFQGCSAGAAAVRIAKDLAENNPGARVLVACCEMASLVLDGLTEDAQFMPSHIVSTALFGDGAACVILGCSPVPKLEKPSFEVHLTKQVLVSDDIPHYIGAEVDENGFVIHLAREVPKAILDSLADSLGTEFLDYSGCKSYNDMFWVVHPGGKAVLDSVVSALELKPDKVAASRHILSECGNMSSATVLFVLEEVRKRRQSMEFPDATTTGEWGIMLAFGPGITVEAILLRSSPV